MENPAGARLLSASRCTVDVAGQLPEWSLFVSTSQAFVGCSVWLNVSVNIIVSSFATADLVRTGRKQRHSDVVVNKKESKPSQFHQCVHKSVELGLPFAL